MGSVVGSGVGAFFTFLAIIILEVEDVWKYADPAGDAVLMIFALLMAIGVAVLSKMVNMDAPIAPAGPTL